jgi:hypothetical protein
MRDVDHADHAMPSQPLEEQPPPMVRSQLRALREAGAERDDHVRKIRVVGCSTGRFA